jgi:hypothetical protein
MRVVQVCSSVPVGVSLHFFRSSLGNLAYFNALFELVGHCILAPVLDRLIKLETVSQVLLGSKLKGKHVAKDRNSMAKRQREIEKRQKAADKRDKRTHRKEVREHTDERSDGLSDGEVRVLKIFRRYLMTPGQMLCLSGQEFETNKNALQELITIGFLVAEEFKGGYSLTDAGFRAMKTQTGTIS